MGTEPTDGPEETPFRNLSNTGHAAGSARGADVGVLESVHREQIREPSPPVAPPFLGARDVTSESNRAFILRIWWRGNRKKVGAVALAALVAATVAGWVVAKQQTSVAARWHSRDSTQVATNVQLTTVLAQARLSITTLNGRVTTENGRISTLNSQVSSYQSQISGLHGQIATLQSQVSVIATQKEKAIDQNTLLSKLLSAAGAVSTDLESCVTDTDTFETELFNDINYGDVLSDPSLQSNAEDVDAECNDAETANQGLQSAINGETS